MFNIWTIVETIYEMLLKMIFGFPGDNYNSFRTETRLKQSQHHLSGRTLRGK